MTHWWTLFATLLGVGLGAIITWIIGKSQQKDFLRRLKDLLRAKWHISLDEEFLTTILLGQKMKTAKYTPDVIFALSPGGLMIAEWLSRREIGSFHNPIPVRSVTIKSVRETSGLITKSAVVENNLEALTNGLSKDTKVLIVNDITRGGTTLRAAYDFLKDFFPEDKIVTATLFCFKHTRAKPLFSAVETDKTVLFDWKERTSE